jgi:hypothetical protein
VELVIPVLNLYRLKRYGSTSSNLWLSGFVFRFSKELRSPPAKDGCTSYSLTASWSFRAPEVNQSRECTTPQSLFLGLCDEGCACFLLPVHDALSDFGACAFLLVTCNRRYRPGATLPCRRLPFVRERPFKRLTPSSESQGGFQSFRVPSTVPTQANALMVEQTVKSYKSAACILCNKPSCG